VSLLVSMWLFGIVARRENEKVKRDIVACTTRNIGGILGVVYVAAVQRGWR
jgi:hypothetical protein